MSILDRIIAVKREEVAARKRKIPVRDLEATLFARRKCLSVRQALEQSATGIIAEFKRKSPSKGFIHENAGVQEVVLAYQREGAAVCSVLTDRTFFGGDLLDLALARQVAGLPLLRKDFVVDEYQLIEAKAAGADAVLLIAAVLSLRQCTDYTLLAHELGLEVLLEIHGEEELERIGAETDLIGVNNRNLATFRTDIYTSFELASKIPPGYLKVSESGIHSLETLKALRKAGFSGFLIGEHFMQESDPGAALQKFLSHDD